MKILIDMDKVDEYRAAKRAVEKAKVKKPFTTELFYKDFCCDAGFVIATLQGNNITNKGTLAKIEKWKESLSQ